MRNMGIDKAYQLTRIIEKNNNLLLDSKKYDILLIEGVNKKWEMKKRIMEL